MGKIPMVYSGDTLTFTVNGYPYQVDSSMPSFDKVKESLRNQDAPDFSVDALIALTQPITAVKQAVEAAESGDYLPKGTVSVTTSTIKYNGEVITGVLVDRILGLLAEGFDIMPMVRFLENLFTNPADFARDELYLWLETSNLPITEDGYFLAYKNVRGDYKSIHDGKTDNSIGTIVSMPRQNVDAVRDRTCSRGLHFCSASYLPHFSHRHDGHTVLLKINPADVVSIPSDYGNAKGRAWKYEVLSEVTLDPQKATWAAVVAPDGTASIPTPKAVEVPFEERLFDPGTDLAKSLFAACNEIGLTDRETRLDWAYEVLAEQDADADFADSFNELTNAQVAILIKAARAEKEAEDEEVNADAVDAHKQVEVDRINALGIVSLRREASAAGLAGAWKGYSVAQLREFLIGKL